MNYPSSESDTHYVRCLKCLKVIKCSRYDTTCLLDHIRHDHPEVEIVEGHSKKGKGHVTLPFETGTCSQVQISTGENIERNAPSDAAHASILKACEELAGACSDKHVRMRVPVSPRRRSLYRTSIEKWRPSKGTIFCPRCCCNKRPLVRTRSGTSATNACLAACVMSCWPFCFLPCLLRADKKEYLHCANCRNFLGLYDREANCIRPNREFVEEEAQETS